MKRFVAWLTGFIFLVFIAGAGAALAQDKAKDTKAKEPVTKTHLDNDKVKVIETTWKPGDESPSAARGARVFRALKGGTLTRIYPDGKKEKVSYKDGEVRWIDATPPYAIRNEGKTTIIGYSVYPK